MSEHPSECRGKRPDANGGTPADAALTDGEYAQLESYAAKRGVSVEEAMETLASEGLARRVRARTGLNPSAAVLRFRWQRGGAK